MPDKKISQLDPVSAILPDDLFVIARGNENKKITLGDINIINISYDDLEDLKNGQDNHGNNPDELFMTKGQWYYITDKYVYARALSGTELQSQAFYRKHSSSRGSITLVSGSQGSINAITVNGVDILDGPAPFNTTIEETMRDVAGQINGFISTPDFTAVARGSILDIYSDRLQGIASNGFVVAGQVSGAPGDLVLDNETPMNGGKEVLLAVKYDFDNDQISEIVPVGFTDTETIFQQVGVQTTSESGNVPILEMEIQPGQKFTIEGSIDAFYENYFEGLSAKLKICGWRNADEFYVCKADLIICVPWSGGEGEYYNVSISTESVDRPGNALFNQDGNIFTFSGAANIITLDAEINGWGVSMLLDGGDIALSVRSALYNSDVATRNWLFTYNYRILNNNY